MDTMCILKDVYKNIVNLLYENDFSSEDRYHLNKIIDYLDIVYTNMYNNVYNDKNV